MASTVESIFGIDSETLKLNKEKALSEESYKLGVLSSGSNPWATSVAGHHTLLSSIDDASKSIFGGVNDPQLTKSKSIESIFANATGETSLERKESILAGMKEKGFMREAYAFGKEIDAEKAALNKLSLERQDKLFTQQKSILDYEQKAYKEANSMTKNLKDDFQKDLENNPDMFVNILDSLDVKTGGESFSGNPGLARKLQTATKKLISAVDKNNMPLYRNYEDAIRDVIEQFKSPDVKKDAGMMFNPFDNDKFVGKGESNFNDLIQLVIANKEKVANQNTSFSQGIKEIEAMANALKPGEKMIKGQKYKQVNIGSKEEAEYELVK
tara:strand:+ start:3382 stop:4362 length:981 start_codon:yes stop_codon:yes gene_type:complete